MTSVADFLYAIADEIGRPRDSVVPIIKALEENWYDTADSLKNIDNETFDKMKVPRRLVDLIREKLNGKPTQTSKPKSDNIMMIEEPIQKKPTEKSTVKEEKMQIETKLSFRPFLEQLKKETITNEALQESLTLLAKIITNIVTNPKNETFRTLKLFTNAKLKAVLGSRLSAVELLKEIGFQDKGEAFVLPEQKLDISILKSLGNEIQDFSEEAERKSFNPYQASFSSTSQLNMAEFAKNSGSELGSYPEKLEELKRKREAMIKPVIENKEARIFTLSEDKSINQSDKEEDPTSDEALLKAEMLKWAKMMEESQAFSSRRRKEFEELVKRPIFTETAIRVKFPDGKILEGKFSPKETLKNLIDFVKEHLVDPTWNFYLFQTPPFKRVTQKDYKQTFDEAECVPSAIFHFAFEDRDTEAHVKEFVTLKKK